MEGLPRLKTNPSQGQKKTNNDMEGELSFHGSKVSCFGINTYLRQKFKVCNLMLLFWAVDLVDM